MTDPATRICWKEFLPFYWARYRGALVLYNRGNHTLAEKAKTRNPEIMAYAHTVHSQYKHLIEQQLHTLVHKGDGND